MGGNHVITHENAYWWNTYVGGMGAVATPSMPGSLYGVKLVDMAGSV